MLKVEGYTQPDEASVIHFIRKVQAHRQPEMEIIKRSVLIKDGLEVVGMVSYESHDDLGMIRYLLYDARVAGVDIIVEMFFELYKKAYEKGIKKLTAQIPSQEVGTLFELLGFEAVGGRASFQGNAADVVMSIALDK
ncbi:MAG: hypothetical protein FWG67_07905 [Defluviitaleaceae bacterium]|nr:hypothetical protein [Defluviitaleaceae bacterium]